METVSRIWHYLTNLEWTEKVQTMCLFCNIANLDLVYEDKEIVAFKNRKLAGKHHWLIAPRKHIRDIENLQVADLDLLDRMDRVKQNLLNQFCPEHPSLNVHVGYHRGRRRLFRDLFWPDIVSIHHLHLHVIVEPSFWLWLFKYPTWLPLMWKSDRQVRGRLEHLNGKQQ